MKGKSFAIVAVLLLTSSMMACGSDDDDGGGDAAKSSCVAYCDATVAANCTDSADCKSFECEDGLDKATGACATEMKRYYDCMKAQTDVCGQTCSLDVAKCQ
jgi:hypothetical protein